MKDERVHSDEWQGNSSIVIFRFPFIVYKYASRVKLFNLEVHSLKQYRNNNTENINALDNITINKILATTGRIQNAKIEF